jgi:hypothetical protein
MIAALQVSPELEAEVLAAIEVPARSSLYVTPACTPAHDGCLLVIDSDGPNAYGQVLGLAIPAAGGTWWLGCTRCYDPVTWGATGRGRCPECASDRTEAES